MRPLTDEESRWVLRHAGDGVEALSRALGVAEGDLLEAAANRGIVLDWAVEQGETCPWCGRRMTRRGAGWAHGLCEVCWRTHLADVQEQRLAEVEQRRRYERARFLYRKGRDKLKEEMAEYGESVPDLQTAREARGGMRVRGATCPQEGAEDRRPGARQNGPGALQGGLQQPRLPGMP